MNPAPDKPDPNHLPDQGPGKDPQRNSDQELAATGKWMIAGVWVLLLVMLTWFGQKWYEKQENPNNSITTIVNEGRKAVVLESDRQGHYVASGMLDGVPVTFLLDTGATRISIPAKVAAKLDLPVLGEHLASTANGTVTVSSVLIPSVSLGELRRERVEGHINPHMGGEQVLLGMSFLRHFDLSQRGDLLTVAEP